MAVLDFIAPGQKNRTTQMASTQTHLKIGEIRDNILVLKNGGVRAVLKTTSINFNLKSEEEQKAIIYSYQSFLNSLEFPIQILVRSKKLNIDSYIEQVHELGDKQKNSLLQEQTYEYADFVRKLVDYADIMEKEFYVIIPFDPMRAADAAKGNSIQAFFQNMAPRDSYTDIKTRHAEFNRLKKALMQRVNIVESGLENCGLKTNQLQTMELIELFYGIYNPNVSKSSKLKDLTSTSIETDDERVKEEKMAEKGVKVA